MALYFTVVGALTPFLAAAAAAECLQSVLGKLFSYMAFKGEGEAAGAPRVVGIQEHRSPFVLSVVDVSFPPSQISFQFLIRRRCYRSLCPHSGFSSAKWPTVPLGRPVGDPMDPFPVCAPEHGIPYARLGVQKGGPPGPLPSPQCSARTPGPLDGRLTTPSSGSPPACPATPSPVLMVPLWVMLLVRGWGGGRGWDLLVPYLDTGIRHSQALMQHGVPPASFL